MEGHFDIGNMFVYDMFDGDTKIGTCNISIHPKYDGYQCPDSWKDKPVLEIDGFGTVGSQGKGNGRAGLQECYELSQHMGCEGRMVVHATWGAGSFYEHCGFKGNNSGKPGIKYFEPTSENLEKLFQGGKNDNFSFKESTPDFDAWSNFNLDDYSNMENSENIINDKDKKEHDISDKIAKLKDRLNKSDTKVPYRPAQNISKVDLSTLKMYQDRTQNG